MKKYIALFSIITSVLLTACGGGQVQVVNYTPDLRRFDMIDSYGVDTASSNATLTLNPYIDNGLFDVDWQVNSLEDYQVNVRINDRPSINNSFMVYSKICGLGRSCDQSGSAVCEYTSDYTLSCNNSNHPTDIGDLFNQLPKKLYLILEVCDIDSPYCVYDYYPVVME